MPASNVNGERAPLLASRPPSYDAATSDSAAETDAASAVEQDEQPTKPLNQVSRADLVWVLAGLWSAVFLGALDGECHGRLAVSCSTTTLTAFASNRYDRRHSSNANRKPLPKV